DVPAAPLNVALIAFATQAGVSIDTGDAALRSVRAAGLSGPFTFRDGLRRLLQGTGYDFRISRGNVVRVLRRPDRRADRPGSEARSAAPSPSPRSAPDLPPDEIIVSASKQN